MRFREPSIVEILQALFAWKDSRNNLDEFNEQAKVVANSGRGFDRRIVAMHRSSLENIEKAAATNLVMLSELYAPIMQKAFSGILEAQRSVGPAPVLGTRFSLLETDVDEPPTAPDAAPDADVTHDLPAIPDVTDTAGEHRPRLDPDTDPEPPGSERFLWSEHLRGGLLDVR